MTKKILFIVNPASGLIDKTNIEAVISEFANNYKFKWKLSYTEKDDYKEKLQQLIQGYKPDIAVAIGGDGTINQVATELVGTSTELAIIPAGSANGLAYNLNIPADIEEAMHLFLNADSKPIDAIRINEKTYCFHLCDIGLNARIVKRFEKEGSSGLAGYGKQMIKELYSKRTSFLFNLKTPELEKRFRSEMLVIANARSFGTGAIINPPGRTDDGKFEIIVIKPYPWWGLFRLLKMVFFGKMDNLKFIKVIQTTKVTIKLKQPQDLQSDGEIIKDVRLLNFQIVPSAVKVRYN